MNRDVFEGIWKQIRGEAKVWWSKITQNDLDYASGKLDIFAGLLQERYGYTRQLTIKEIDERMTKYRDNQKNNTELAPENRGGAAHYNEPTSK